MTRSPTLRRSLPKHGIPNHALPKKKASGHA
jgi:hypothetical protein